MSEKPERKTSPLIMFVGVLFLVALGFGAFRSYMQDESNFRGDKDVIAQDASYAQLLRTLQDFEKIVEGVKDKETARKAAEQLESITAQIENLAERSKSLKKIPVGSAEAIRAKYESEMRKVQARLQSSSSTIAEKIDGEPTFIAAMEKVMEAARKMQAVNSSRP